MTSPAARPPTYGGVLAAAGDTAVFIDDRTGMVVVRGNTLLVGVAVDDQQVPYYRTSDVRISAALVVAAAIRIEQRLQAAAEQLLADRAEHPPGDHPG